MRALFLRSLPIAFLACCTRTAPPSQTTAATAPSSRVTPTQPVVADAWVLPQGAILTGSLDLTQLDFVAIAKLHSLPRELREGLRLDDGKSTGAAIAELGIDDTHPITFAFGAPTSDTTAAIATLRGLVPSRPPEIAPKPPTPAKIFAASGTAMATVSTVASFRVVIPVRDAARAKSSLEKLLGFADLRPTSPGKYASPDAVANVTGDRDTLVLDVAMGDHPRRGLEELEAAAAKGHVDPPSLTKELLHVSYTPESVAAFGFAYEVRRTLKALSGAGIDPDQRDRIANEGLWEASESFRLARGARGTRFEHIDVNIATDREHPYLRVSAALGPGFEGPSDDLYTPGFAVMGPATIDVSRPFLAGWKVPDDDTALDGTQAFRPMRDAGWPGMLVGLPDLGISTAAMIAEGPFAPKRELLDRLARFGVSIGEDHTSALFIGLLPQGTSRAAAECILVGAAPCGAHRLVLGGVSNDDGAYVRLLEVDGHYVLLRASEAKELTPKLRSGTASPLRVELNLNEIFDGVPIDAIVAPGPLVGTVRRDGHTFVFELARP